MDGSMERVQVPRESGKPHQFHQVNAQSPVHTSAINPDTRSAAGIAQLQKFIGNKAAAQLLAVQAAGVVRPADEEMIQKKPENNTGMPDHLKDGIENLSGHSLNDVRVHYNSDKPATLNALAYTQGTDIHVAPGQEQHLPHEAWHAVQQMQGRVQPTMQTKGVAINDSAELENEADQMGGKAIQTFQTRTIQAKAKSPVQLQTAIIQMVQEKFIPSVKHPIHLHIGIHKPHLKINGDVYPLSVAGDNYEKSKLQEAIEALQGHEKQKGYADCLEWLQKTIRKM